jgi:hypothetical protein
MFSSVSCAPVPIGLYIHTACRVSNDSDRCALMAVSEVGDLLIACLSSVTGTGRNKMLPQGMLIQPNTALIHKVGATHLVETLGAHHMHSKCPGRQTRRLDVPAAMLSCVRPKLRGVPHASFIAGKSLINLELDTGRHILVSSRKSVFSSLKHSTRPHRTTTCVTQHFV